MARVSKRSKREWEADELSEVIMQVVGAEEQPQGSIRIAIERATDRDVSAGVLVYRLSVLTHQGKLTSRMVRRRARGPVQQPVEHWRKADSAAPTSV